MIVNAPFGITLYGTNEYFESSAASEVTKTDVTTVTYESQAINCFILRPFYRYTNEVTSTGGFVQKGISIQFQKFEIVTDRLTNILGDYSDMAIYEQLVDVLNYDYKFLEITKHFRTLHTAGKLIKGIVTKCEPVVAVKRIYLELEFEKERPE